jgi:hypothetical protein
MKRVGVSRGRNGTLLPSGFATATAVDIHYIYSATVVTNRTTYWTEIRSPRITMDNAAQGNDTPLSKGT